ncbi:MAG: peptide chain release factor N(5)-glutamine methyltransferase [Sulfuricellaceae bacterium]
MTLQQALRHNAAWLATALDLTPHVARLEAQVLLCHALHQPRAWLIAHDRDALDGVRAQAYSALLERRLAGEPIAYILGEREFFGLNFKVTPAVLIPRPETELLVELALAHLPENRAARVLDLGAGSGAVAIAIAKHRPPADVVALDVSAAALEIAQENARRLMAANMRFLLSSWFDALPAHERFDIIVSNPPYIAANDPHLRQGDLRFEPSAALASGKDGLDDLRTIVAGAPARLAPGGRLLFEHGYDQAERCRELLRQAGFAEISSSADLAGIERVTQGRLPGLE